MRKAIVSVLMIPLLLLGGCGEREAALEKGFSAFRGALAGADALSAVVRLTADYGGTEADYVLELNCDGDETAVTVVEPALIAGVKASVKWGQTSVTYEGVMLGVSPLDEEGVTPVSALPVMLHAMAEGYTELLWWEGGYIAARLYAGETSACTVWIDGDTLTPVAAEISSAGVTVVTCRFSDWQLDGEQ